MLTTIKFEKLDQKLDTSLFLEKLKNAEFLDLENLYKQVSSNKLLNGFEA